MASRVDIYNFALAHVGVTPSITDTTERSAEANICNLFYPQVVREMYEEWPWPHSMKTGTLALSKKDPNSEWAFAYGYPTDAMRVIRILSGVQPETNDSQIAFKVYGEGPGRRIYTNQDSAEAEWVFLEDQEDKWPAGFAMAVSHRLAVKIAPKLTSNPTGLSQLLQQQYNLSVTVGRVSAGNEGNPGLPAESEFIRGR